MHRIADGLFIVGTLLLWYPAVGVVPPVLAGVWLGMTALVLALAMVVKVGAWGARLVRGRERG